MASHHEFKAFKEWILATLEETEPFKPIHPLAVSLLKRFAHLYHAEIPTGLPRKRDIQRQIDLIPRAVLPNKPDYRVNSKDTMKIQ